MFEHQISFLKELTFCGPQHETCVSKQTLQDDSCLVACDGLYADITDDSLKEKNMDLQKRIMALQQKTMEGAI